MSPRRLCDQDFKRNVVLLNQEPGRTVSSVADNLGIGKISYIVGDVNTFIKPAFSVDGIESLSTEEKR